MPTEISAIIADGNFVATGRHAKSPIDPAIVSFAVQSKITDLFLRLTGRWLSVEQIHPFLDHGMSISVGNPASNHAAFDQLKVDSGSRFSIVDGHFPAHLHKRRGHGLNPIATGWETGQAIYSVRISGGFKLAAW